MTTDKEESKNEYQKTKKDGGKNGFNLTLGELLNLRESEYPQEEAAVYPELGLRYTYREFKKICNQAAKGFMKLGIKQGDHVAVWSHNRPEWLITQFATGKMGCILVTVNTNYRAMELKYLLKHSDTQTLIVSDGKRVSFPELIYKICPELKHSQPGKLKSEKFPHLKNVIYIGKGKAPPGMYHWN